MLGTDIRGIMAEEEEVQRRQEALQSLMSMRERLLRESLEARIKRARGTGDWTNLSPWLFILPSELELLCKDEDEVPAPLSTLTGGDPVLERMLLAAGHDRTLYVLLTALLQSGDPKLLRAAEVSLRSLVKQSKQATVPWQSRPPGHFEPPSD